MSESSTQPSAPPVALCLGGVDPSSGAGLFRDVMTLASLGIHPMAVPVAETIQSGLGCSFIEAPGTSPLLRIDALRPHLADPWGLKLGLCALEIEQLRLVLALLRELAPSVRIWDPIQAPSVGVGLHSSGGIKRMAETLLGDGEWIVSPNRVEAAALGGHSEADPEALAQPWLALGAKAVWLKGGHASGDQVEDFWITREGACSLGAWPRLPGERRGTGCTLASAWLGLRLRGMSEIEAAVRAAQWLREHWEQAFAPGGAGRPCFAPEMA
jgi:hydroxymethylpyrimidine/phosphomethylpyrimidine kinase